MYAPINVAILVFPSSTSTITNELVGFDRLRSGIEQAPPESRSQARHITFTSSARHLADLRFPRDHATAPHDRDVLAAHCTIVADQTACAWASVFSSASSMGPTCQGAVDVGWNGKATVARHRSGSDEITPLHYTAYPFVPH